MKAKKIIRLSTSPQGFGQAPDKLAPELFISKLPTQHTHEYVHDEKLGLFVGVWDTTDLIETAGLYPCDEFMWLLEGEAAIKNCKTGRMETAVAGEPFIIPKGYNCQWHQTGYLRKFFFISENPNEPTPEMPAYEGIIIPRAETQMAPVLTAEPFLTEKDTAFAQQHICYKDSTGKFLAGTWKRDPFESKTAPFPYHGFAQVITGSLTFSDEQGVKHSFGPGEVLFLPEGLICSAKATEKVKLFFAILKPG